MTRVAAHLGIPGHMIESGRPTMTATEVSERAKVAVRVFHAGQVKLMELSRGLYDRMMTTLAEEERRARLRRIRQNRPRRRLSGGRWVSKNARRALRPVRVDA